MSTTIAGAYGGQNGWRLLVLAESDGVRVATSKPSDCFLGATFSRTDFLAAVESECNVRLVPADAIVIERGELPEVQQVGRDRLDYRVTFADGSSQTFSDETADTLDVVVMGWVAIREYLRAHPPVDEAQVEALAVALIDANMDDPEGPTPYTVARRLLATGRVQVTP